MAAGLRPALLDRLGGQEIDSLLLEGGGTLNWSMLEAGLVQGVQAYVSPKLLGGERAKTPVAGLGAEDPDHAVRLTGLSVTPIGEDILLEGEVLPDVHRDR